MSDESRILAGILLLSLVTVETGGLYLVKLVRGRAEATPFQLAFARAGHAHAGVLLVPAGFFFSSMGAGREQPNGLIAMVFTGAAVLAAGLSALGVGLLTA